jgi:HEAT repeat protein
VEKAAAIIDRLEADARHGEQGPRANALWRIGLLGNRGVEPERAFEILMSAIHDENVNVRYWAVEGLAYLGTEDVIGPPAIGVSRRYLADYSRAGRMLDRTVGHAERAIAADRPPPPA